ncbi:hypothetical protein [Deinococcus wulumuqiensis]|uniref:Uncharacterized protein n=1 Tax=Deinococcus wulumuqiensis TaxID=980427 RepID=A0AAV4K831_9DEIO|nr:hypothetical protein [Deinococcus wulumuqiensis]QII22454.1 hypothetical protein G6R31_16490 [Deinococcus wulumuqiensis R12]GGI85794.1 hypothetical protein GCM10010914_20320 [Deinococcus wulumuqiensis]GGP30176.1 hypothetical protein GCM10008021_18270 [Deinococcus wulumuqiensis]
MSDIHTQLGHVSEPHHDLDYGPADYGPEYDEYDLDPTVDYGPKQVSYTQAERDYIQRHLAFVETIIKAEVADVTLAHLLLSKARALRRDMHKLRDQQLYHALDGYMM